FETTSNRFIIRQRDHAGKLRLLYNRSGRRIQSAIKQARSADSAGQNRTAHKQATIQIYLLIGDLTRSHIVGFLDEHTKLEPIRRSGVYFQVSDDFAAPSLTVGLPTH